MSRVEGKYAVEDRGYETPCWIWAAHCNSDGYGRLWDGLAHRISYEEARRPIPRGLGLDHLCNQRACVNPDHLEPATQAVNCQRGKTAKLGAAGVAEVRRLREAGLTMRAIAKRLRVDSATVSNVLTGKSWVNV